MNCKQFCSPLTTRKIGFVDIKKVKVKLRDFKYLPVCDANDFNSIFSVYLA